MLCKINGHSGATEESTLLYRDSRGPREENGKENSKEEEDRVKELKRTSERFRGKQGES